MNQNKNHALHVLGQLSSEDIPICIYILILIEKYRHSFTIGIRWSLSTSFSYKHYLYAIRTLNNQHSSTVYIHIHINILQSVGHDIHIRSLTHSNILTIPTHAHMHIHKCHSATVCTIAYDYPTLSLLCNVKVYSQKSECVVCGFSDILIFALFKHNAK